MSVLFSRHAHIDKAKAVIEKIKATSLSIIQARTNFEKKIGEFNEIEPATAFTPRQVPSHIASEVEVQLVSAWSLALKNFL